MISDDQVREIKARCDLVDVMGGYTSLKKAGSNFTGCCPFHNERTPSLTVYVDQQTFHCFGCGKHGDVIALVREREALDFKDAVEVLARRVGIEIKQSVGTQATPRSERVALADAFEQAVRFYEHCLWESDAGAAAREYLSSRGLSVETCKRFRAGWAPGRGALLTKAHQLGIDQRLLRENDLLVERDGRLVDRFFDRITFPICDRFGSPVAISARVLPAAERAAKEANRPLGKYVNTAETPLYRKGSTVFNLHRARTAAKDAGRLLIFEGQTGVLAASEAGIHEAVACLGTALTIEHVKQLANLAGDTRVTIVFDGDGAGRANALKAVTTCFTGNLPILIASLPDGFDPAELLAEAADKEQGRITFEQSIQLAQPGLEFLLHALAPNPKDLDDRSRVDVADQALAAIKDMPDELLRDLHLRHIAGHLRLEKSFLKRRAPWSDKSGTANRPLHSSRLVTPRGSGNSQQGDEPATDDAEPIRGLDDQGNAERFITRHGQNLRYCFEYGKNGWFIWTGSHWKQDTTQEVNRLVVETLNTVLPKEAHAYRLRAEDALDDSTRRVAEQAAQQVESWLRTSRNQRKIEAVLTVAQKEPGVGVVSAQLNQDPWLFACTNGTIDLRVGTLREAKREDLITRCSPSSFDANATSDRWTNFLNDLTRSDAAMIAYLQRAAGYSMSGSTREEVMFLVHGPGGSGKSTFMSAIETVLGDYAETIDFEMFLANNVGKRETYYAALQPARLVQCEESGDGKRFAEDVVKKVTGGNRLQARHLYGSAYSYVPRFKVWMVTNELPRVSDTDSGFWRRVQVIGCTNEIPVERRDKDFKDWLRSDQGASSALLAWCVAGAKAYFERGLAPPETITAENAAYRLANDPLQEFLDEYTFWAQGNVVTKSELTETYRRWVEESNQGRPLSAKAFAKRMEARGAVQGKTRVDAKASGPVGCWRNLRLRTDADNATPPNAPSAAGLTPKKSGTASSKVSGPVAVPVDARSPSEPSATPIDQSTTSTGTANAVPGQMAGTEKIDVTNGEPTTGTPGQQNPAHVREGTNIFLNFPTQKENTEICNPAVPDGAPPDETRDSRGTRLSRPPNADEDLLDETDDDDQPPF